MKQIKDNLEPEPKYKSFWDIFFNCMAIAIGSLNFGFTIAQMTTIPTKQILRQFQIPLSEAVTTGLLTGSAPVGAGIGCLLSLAFLERFSRRGILIMASSLMILSTSLTMIGAYHALFLGRVLQGICMGFYTSVCPLFIKQLSPKELSNQFGTMHHFMCIAGILLTVILSLFIDDQSEEITPIWRIIYSFPLIFSFFQIFLLVFIFQDETPRYYLLKGQNSKAFRLIEKIYKKQFVFEVYDQQVEDATASSERTGQDEPDDHSYWLRIFFGIHMLNLQQYCGNKIAMLYCRPILKSIIGSTTAKFLQMSIILVKLLGCLVTIKALSSVGNKLLLQSGVFCCVLLNLATAIGFSFSEGTTRSILVVGSVMTLMLVFNFTAGPVLWGYVPAIVQPKAIPFVTFMHWMTVSLLLFLFPIIKQHVQEMYIFLFLATLSLAALLVNQVLMIDTKNLSQLEIRQKFDNLFKIQ